MRGFLEDLDFRRWILRLTAARRDVLDHRRAARLGALRYRRGIARRHHHIRRHERVRCRHAGDARGERSRHCVPGSVRPRSGAVRSVDPGSAREGRRPSLSRDAARPRRRVTARAIHGFGCSLSRDDRVRRRARAPHGDSRRGEQRRASADRRRCRSLRRRTARSRHSRRIRGRSPIDMLDRLGVLDARPLLIHCVRVDEGDIAAIVRSGCAVAHCPISNSKLGHGVAPLVELLAAGVTVGLGSDSVASNNRMDLLDEARVALLSQRTRLQSFETPSAADVLELATLGAPRRSAWPTSSGRSRKGSRPTSRPSRSTPSPRRRIRRRPLSSRSAALRRRSWPWPGNRSCPADGSPAGARNLPRGCRSWVMRSPIGSTPGGKRDRSDNGAIGIRSCRVAGVRITCCRAFRHMQLRP